MERDTAYKTLIRGILATIFPAAAIIDPADRNSNWTALQVFESGDDREALDAGYDLFEGVPLRGWKIEGDGRTFVRCHEGDEGGIVGT